VGLISLLEQLLKTKTDLTALRFSNMKVNLISHPVEGYIMNRGPKVY